MTDIESKVEQVVNNFSQSDEDLSEKTVVYFDQNIWGALIDETAPIDVDEFYDLVLQSKEELNFIYPFSVENLVETTSHQEPDFTKELYSYMIDLSNCYTVRQFRSVLDYEAVNFVCRYHPLLLELNMKTTMIGKGMQNFGGVLKYVGDGNPDPDARKDILKVLKNEEINREILLSETMVEESLGVIEEEKAEMTEQYQTMLEDTDYQLNINSNKDRLSYITDSFIYHMIPRLRDACDHLDYSIERLMRETLDPYSFEEFYAQFPAFYTYAHLAFTTEAYDRRPEFNDILDMSSLSAATPYCDIVVVEEFFGSQLYRHDIHEQYDTNIFYSVSRFDTFLRDELDVK